MSLSKKMILFITSLVVVLLLGTFIVNFQNTKNFLQDQLSSHAQDTATSLGLSLSSIANPNDISSMETMINAVFDRGYYSKIQLLTPDNQVIYERQTSNKIEHIPPFFIDLVSIEAPTAESLVQSGWVPIGQLHVQSHLGYAYIELWESGQNLLIWFTSAALMSILLAITALRLILRPLKEMEKQATAIVKKEYLLQEKLPNTTEFKQVVSAMNAMVHKLQDVFERDAHKAEKLQKMAYRDSVTGLSNRLHFHMQFEQLLDPSEAKQAGSICMLRIHNLKELNDQYGYKTGDRLMHSLAQKLQFCCQAEEALYARINGTELIAVLPGNKGELTKTHAEEIAYSKDKILADFHIDQTPSYISLGVIDYQAGEKRGSLMTHLDFALQQAKKLGKNQVYYNYRSQDQQFDAEQSQQWLHILQTAINEKRFTLFEQAVYDANGKSYDKELFIRMKDEDGKIFSAGYFMPAVIQLNLIKDIDKMVLLLAFEHLEQFPNDPISINLTQSIIQSETQRQWLLNYLTKLNSKALSFEMPEKIVNESPDIAWPIIKTLKAKDIRFGIDHFGSQMGNMNYLQELQPSYVKLDAAFAQAIRTDPQAQQYVHSLYELCDGLDIQIIATSIETENQIEAFKDLNITHFQGFYYGAPQPFTGQAPQHQG